jgi:SAM-dependent methyltransferase
VKGTLSACRVCAGPVIFAYSVREMMIGTRDCFDYFDCQDCGCLQIGAIPTNLDRYYVGPYYTKNQRMPFGEPGGRFRLRRRLARLRLGEGGIARALSGRRYGRFDWFRRTRTALHDEILDVGCGSGRLLRRLYGEGFERLTGIDHRIETNSEAGVYPRFERVSLEDHRGRYHLVMAHHSFEHMADPVRAFEAFGNLVEAGGYLVLRLPVANCLARREYGADWVQLDAPRHLHLHTRRSIEILAARSGFRIAHVVDDSGPFQIWGSELYRRDIALTGAGRAGRAVLGLSERLAARSVVRKLSRAGIGDQACFYLQRTVESPSAQASRALPHSVRENSGGFQ